MEATNRSSSEVTPLLRLKNVAAAVAVVVVACAIYLVSPYNQSRIGRLYGFEGFSIVGGDFLVTAALWYTALLVLYYLFEQDPGPSKSLISIRVLARWAGKPSFAWRDPLARDERTALLTTLLKGFFAPMMTMSLMAFFMGALVNAIAIVKGGAFDAGMLSLFDRYGFWFALQFILFVDVTIFTVGYLIEVPRLGNEIRSVDPTLMGWGAALVCYPPFNIVTSYVLGSPVSDFPRFDDPIAHLGLNIALLTLLGLYASASVALGLKASNLTHRGIVARGPYAVIRHPAYVCKNLAWWIASVPLIAVEFDHSTFGGIQAMGSVIGWSMIYILRALTEEDHLRSLDGEYARYADKVRFRFIPGVI